MSSLKEKITQDLKGALKDRDRTKVSITRLLLADIHNLEIQKREKITEDDILGILSQALTKHQDSIKQFRAAEREDLAVQEEAELKIIQSYLPPPLNAEELQKLVWEAFSCLTEAKESINFGKVMQKIMPKVKGRASGEVVSAIVKEELSRHTKV